VNNLLPPASTPLERALVGAIVPSIDAVPVDFERLWNPATCAIELLPWLAWALSIDRWDPSWSDAEKRAAVGSAIAVQRRKGTRRSVEEVLASFDALLELVEWFEATPQLEPYTFEVRLALVEDDGVAGGASSTADFARAIVEEVSRVKPIRAHFTLVQQLTLSGTVLPFAAAQATGYRRLDFAASDAAGTPWTDLLQDQNGEPLEDDAGNFIDGSPV
jgi:phage tail P2-like protein